MQFPDQYQLLLSLQGFDFLQGIDTHSLCKQSEKDNLARTSSALYKVRISYLSPYPLGTGKDSGDKGTVTFLSTVSFIAWFSEAVKELMNNHQMK